MIIQQPRASPVKFARPSNAAGFRLYTGCPAARPLRAAGAFGRAMGADPLLQELVARCDPLARALLSRYGSFTEAWRTLVAGATSVPVAEFASACRAAGVDAPMPEHLTAAGSVTLAALDPAGDAACRALRVGLRTPVNNIEYFLPNFEGLVLGCIDADFCK